MAAGFYAGGGATVLMDSPPTAFVKVFREGGDVSRVLRHKAEKVATTARFLAPVGETGRLSSSIRITRNYIPGRFVKGYSVYSNIYYGYYVHEGTDPSLRFTYPGYMKFRGTNAFAGQRIRTRVVFHPGTPANPFLQNALIAMVQ